MASKTRSELAAELLPALDTAAGSMATAIAAFQGAYIDARAFDQARSRLGAGELGQRLDQDRINTIACSAHPMHGTAPETARRRAVSNAPHTNLFDGQSLQPQIESAAKTIIDGLRASNPEAFV